jgi:hypothetical protein
MGADVVMVRRSWKKKAPPNGSSERAVKKEILFIRSLQCLLRTLQGKYDRNDGFAPPSAGARAPNQ